MGDNVDPIFDGILDIMRPGQATPAPEPVGPGFALGVPPELWRADAEPVGARIALCARCRTLDPECPDCGGRGIGRPVVDCCAECVAAGVVSEAHANGCPAAPAPPAPAKGDDEPTERECPFCGGEVTLSWNIRKGTTYWYLVCVDGPSCTWSWEHSNAAKLLTAWNGRAADAALATERSRTEALVRSVREACSFPGCPTETRIMELLAAFDLVGR